MKYNRHIFFSYIKETQKLAMQGLQGALGVRDQVAFHRVLLLNYLQHVLSISWYNGAAGASAITSAFQPTGRRKD